MADVLNLTQYMKQAYTKKAEFIYRGTAALKKGRGMCFNLDYANSSVTGKKVSDNFGARGLKEIQRPDNTNNMAFAGVLTQNYAANPNGLVRKVQLALPGSCALVSGRSAIAINNKRITCNAGGADPGIFAFAGHPGLGSALPLRTEAEADGGDIAHINTAGTATAVYDSATGLTTITSTGAGDAVGFTDSDITATDFECTVLGGADDSTGGDTSSGELATKAVYPVVASTSANAFTVTGDTGDCDLTIVITKKELLILAYLDDGAESGLLEIVTPQDDETVQNMVGGTTLACGGYTMAVLSDSVLADGIVEGQMKSIGGLGILTTAAYVVTVTSGIQEDHSTGISTVTIDAAAETIVLQWLGNIGIATGGLWHELHNIGATIA